MSNVIELKDDFIENQFIGIVHDIYEEKFCRVGDIVIFSDSGVCITHEKVPFQIVKDLNIQFTVPNHPNESKIRSAYDNIKFINKLNKLRPYCAAIIMLEYLLNIDKSVKVTNG